MILNMHLGARSINFSLNKTNQDLWRKAPVWTQIVSIPNSRSHKEHQEQQGDEESLSTYQRDPFFSG